MRSILCALVCSIIALTALPATAQISGTVTYTGTQSGRIVVEAFTESDETFEKLTTSMINPGPFEFTMVAEGSYTVIAYIDANDDARLGGDETWIEAGAPVAVPPGSSSVTLDLDAFVVPGGDEGDDADEGCCATVQGDERSPAAIILGLLGALLWRRRPV